MPEDKKKKVKVRPGYNPRTNAMRTRREGAPGSGTRKGKATRGGQKGGIAMNPDLAKRIERHKTRKDQNLSDKINTFFKSGGGNLPDAPELLDRLGAKGIDIEKWKKDYPEVY